MIKEAYVSFEVAKLLKEKGFNGQCRAAYTNYGKLFTTQIQQYITNVVCSKGTLWECAAPTHQMACAWLREKHNIFFCVHPDYPIVKDKYIIEFYNDGEPSGMLGNWDTYEEAVDIGIKYALNNLLL